MIIATVRSLSPSNTPCYRYMDSVAGHLLSKLLSHPPPFSFLVLPILSFGHFSRLTFSLLPFTPRLSSSRLSASSSTRLCCESQWDLALCQVMCYQPRHRLTQTQTHTQTHTNKQTHTCTYICTRNLMQECDGKRSLARSSY